MSSTPGDRRNALIGLILVLLGALGFSAKAILIKLAYADDPSVDAIALMALRMLFTLPIFLLLVVWQRRNNRQPALTRKQWWAVTILGLDGYYLSSYLDFSGLQYISAGLERIILFLYPTFVVLFSAVWLRRKIGLAVALALLSSYAGMVLVFVEQLTAASSSNLWLGSGLVLGSALMFAGFTMGSGVMGHKIGSARFTAYTMIAACIATLIHFGIQRGMALGGFAPKIYWLALLMTIFSTVLPALFMNAGIRRIGAGPAAIVSTTGPIATLVLAHWILHEAISRIQIGGTLLVLVGVYLVGRSKSRPF